MGFIINPYAFGAAYDADAQAFFTAAGITDNTQKTAVNQLVVDLKGYGIWTKMKALYPFVGGTATTHKWNLKDPQDTDAAFRLVFSGGITHSSTGVKGNGTNAYFDTKLTPSNFSKDDNSSGIYVRTNVAEDKAEYGAFTFDQNSLQFFSRYGGNIFTRNFTGSQDASIINTDTRGFYQMTRRNSSNYIVSKGTTKTTINIASQSGTLNNTTKYLGLAMTFGGAADFFSSKEIAFHYYGLQSLTDTELDNFYTAVQAFQTTLSRNV